MCRERQPSVDVNDAGDARPRLLESGTNEKRRAKTPAQVRKVVVVVVVVKKSRNGECVARDFRVISIDTCDRLSTII